MTTIQQINLFISYGISGSFILLFTVVLVIYMYNVMRAERFSAIGKACLNAGLIAIWVILCCLVIAFLVDSDSFKAVYGGPKPVTLEAK